MKNPPPPSVVAGSNYLLSCRACKTHLGQLRAGRVLAAPGEGWRHGATNWFCCVNRLERAPDLGLRETDLLYGPATFCLHRAVLESLAVGSCSSSQSQLPVVSCPTCGVEIGAMAEEMVECWYAALIFLREDDDKKDQPHSETVAGSLTPIHPAGASWDDNFLAFLAARAAEMPDRMPRLMLSPRGDDQVRLHIWIVDRQLTILQSCGDDTDNVLAVRTVTKVLFKIGESVGDDSPVEVADSLFRAGRSLLEESCRNFPLAVRSFQDYQVAFLPEL
jgi:hypothetical protein